MALILSGLPGSLAPAFATGALDAQQCLARSGTVKLSGTYSGQYKVASPPSDKTYDARTATFTGAPFSTLYPFTLGVSSPGVRLCVVGGKVVGQQSRTLTWQQMKTNYDGDGLRIVGQDWYAVDGLRVDNMEDGVAPRAKDTYPKGGDGFELRNAYFKYIRDDCIENDDIVGGVVRDVLFDGCSTGISERPTDGTPQWNYPAPSGEQLVLDNVLMRLQAMPGPRGTSDPSILGHGQLFKWSNVANKLVIRNSIFLVEKKPNTKTTDFPAGTVAQNVTVVWLGGGAFPGKLPSSGVKVTTNRAVWDQARATWLQRHGCSSFDACSKLTNPDPLAGATSSGSEPTPTAEPTPTPTPEPTSTPTPTPTPTPEPVPTVRELVIGADADATLAQKHSSRNYGASGSLSVQGSPTLETLMRFSVQGIGSANVVSARLVLSCIDGAAGGGIVAPVADDQWREDRVTWANAPAAAGEPIGSVGGVQAGRTYEIDVTSMVRGDGVYSLRLLAEVKGDARFASKEGTDGSKRPRLVIRFG